MPLTDLFAATPSDLEPYFVGWKTPLDAPVERTSTNPFTKRPQTYLSWDPDPECAVVEAKIVGVGHPEPYIDMKGLDTIQIEALIRVLHASPAETLRRFDRPVLIGPKDGPWLHELPSPFVAKLAALADDDLAPTGRRWLLETISKEKGDSLTKAQRADIPRFAENLRELSKLARACVLGDKHMYMWMCL